MSSLSTAPVDNVQDTACSEYAQGPDAAVFDSQLKPPRLPDKTGRLAEALVLGLFAALVLAAIVNCFEAVLRSALLR
jgi:hypothetical protein